MTAATTIGQILVLGSTGKTGRRVAQRLRARGLGVRDGSRSATPRFDWERRETWHGALAGVERVYITYQPDLAFAGAAESVGEFARVAVAGGVKRLVLLSGRGEEGAIRAEQAVQESGADWTIVRASFFFQNFTESEFLSEGIRSGAVYFPAAEVVEPFIDADDVADVVAVSLTEDSHVGHVYEVTGPRLLTFGEAVGEIARAAAREIAYVPVSTEEYRAGMVEAGVPAEFAAELTALFAEVLDGRNAYVADGVQRALGRPARDFREFVQRSAQTGVWAESAVVVG